MTQRFPVWYFCSVLLSKSMCISALGPSSSPYNSFTYIAYLFGLFVMFSWLSNFTLKLFSLICIRFLVCFYVISPYLLVEFPFVVLECPVLSVLFYPFSISFQSSLFRHFFLFYFLKLYCFFFLCCLFLLSLRVPAFFLCFLIFACFCRFLSSFPVRFPIKVLIFCLCSLREPQFSHKIFSLLHKLVHLIPLCFLLIYI